MATAVRKPSDTTIEFSDRYWVKNNLPISVSVNEKEIGVNE